MIHETVPLAASVLSAVVVLLFAVLAAVGSVAGSRTRQGWWSCLLIGTLSVVSKFGFPAKKAFFGGETINLGVNHYGRPDYIVQNS